MMNRKLIALLLAVVMLLALVACDTTDPNPSTDPKPSQTDPKPSETDPKPTETDPKPSEPQGTEVYNGLTDVMLDALPGVTADIFQTHMDVDWNFGWEGDASLAHNATKADFDGTADASKVIWRLGTLGESGMAMTDNAGWGVSLWTKGAGNVAFMYNKVDVPETATEFRVWASSNTDNHWSGSGAIRAVALYKDENGQYVKHIMTPIEETFTGEKTTAFHDDGTVRFSNAIWNMPDTLDGCMLIYDMEVLKGREDVVIVIEGVGLGEILGDEFTEAAEGVPAGEVMPEMVIIKRVIFC